MSNSLFPNPFQHNANIKGCVVNKMTCYIPVTQHASAYDITINCKALHIVVQCPSFGIADIKAENNNNDNLNLKLCPNVW